ncbi:transposase [Bradyrhizobium sp. USDA 3311]
MTKPVGKPDAGKPHVRFDERGEETERATSASPRLSSTLLKRKKNDAADAEAICEAAQRPTMRFVAVKSEEQQAAAIVFRARDLLVRQRTQTINALRGHLTEFGVVAAQGPFHVAKLVSAIIGHDTDIPELARPIHGCSSSSCDP